MRKFVVHDSVAVSSLSERKIETRKLGIKKFLHLDQPIYQSTSAYGHFGRNFDEEKGYFSWEDLNMAEKLGGDYR